jgi:hypothetical protein
MMGMVDMAGLDGRAEMGLKGGQLEERPKGERQSQSRMPVLSMHRVCQVAQKNHEQTRIKFLKPMNYLHEEELSNPIPRP